MTIRDVRATLTIYGRTPAARASRVTELLGIEPDRSHEAGGLHSRPERAARGDLAQLSYWTFGEPEIRSTAGDLHGAASLDGLAARFAQDATALRTLSATHKIVVWIFGRSDSHRAGFAVAADTMSRLGRLSASVVFDFFLDDPQDEDPGARDTAAGVLPAASLSVYGDDAEHSSATVTAALGMTPYEAHDFGDPSVSAKLLARGRSQRPFPGSFWDFEEAASTDPHDWLATLRHLAERFEPKASVLARLAGDGYRIIIRLWVPVGTSQANFTVAAETMRRLGRLSAEFHPTVDLNLGDPQG